MGWIQITFAMSRERSAKLKSLHIPPHKQIEPEVAPTAASEVTQTEEFEYLFERLCVYKAPGRDFFDTDDKVRFYTRLPSIEVLI